MSAACVAPEVAGREGRELDHTYRCTGKFIKNFRALRAQANFESNLEKYVAGPTRG